MQTFAEVEQALRPYIAVASRTLGEDITIDRTVRLAHYVGSPHDRLRVIHVAGTSGKTSTCYMIRELLQQAGLCTALTVSPHIYAINERVQIDGQPLEEKQFCSYMDEFLQLVTSYSEMPTYFELMMVFAYWVAVREEVDYAVIETGLGGQQDSSNICQLTNKVAVVTDIGYDHMHVLGSTLTAIATQKAGIISPNSHAVMYRQASEVMNAVQMIADERGATLHVVEPPDANDYRQRNAHLASVAYRMISDRDNLPPLDDCDQIAASVCVPGRMTVRRERNQVVIYDGAHNAQKASALVRTLQSEYYGQPFTVVLAMKQGKEYEEVIDILLPITERAVVAPFASIQDTPIKSINPAELAKIWRRHGIEAEQAESLADALDIAQRSNSPILVTGSLYAVSELLQ